MTITLPDGLFFSLREKKKRLRKTRNGREIFLYTYSFTMMTSLTENPCINLFTSPESASGAIRDLKKSDSDHDVRD
jgi:hypothetical protein